MNLKENCTQSYVEFAHAFTQLIKSKLKIDDFPVSSREREVFVDDGTDTQHFEVLDIFRIWEIDGHDIAALNETKVCVELHLKEAVIASPKFSDNEGNQIHSPSTEQLILASLSNFLRWPFIHSIETAQTLNFSDNHLVEVYGTYFDKWTAKDLNYQTRIPIIGLTSNALLVKLDDELKVTCLSREEKSKFYLPSRFSGFRDSLTFFDLMSCTHEIIWEYSLQKGEPSPDIKATIQPVVSAFRLHKSGNIWVRFHLTRSLPDVPHTTSSLPNPISGFYPAEFGNDFDLEEKDVEPIKMNFGALRRVLANNQNKSFGLALSRFNSSFEKRNLEDRLLDIVIALECSLLPNVRNELQHRLSLRGAVLLRRQKSPKETYDLLSLMYETRSQLVHGSQNIEDLFASGKFVAKVQNAMRLEHVNPVSFYSACEEVSRNVLREVLHKIDSGPAINDLMADVDRTLLNQLSI